MAEPKPWLVGRSGEHVDSVVNEERSAELPAGLPEMPRLESGIFPDSVGPTADGVWYLPEFVLFDDEFDEDPEFSFAAEQNGEVAEDGGPFNRAVLTVAMDAVVPDHLTAFEGETALHQVPDLDPGVELIVPITESGGRSGKSRWQAPRTSPERSGSSPPSS
ncbi:hypothetical protein ACFQ1B_06045 [Streptomyces mexicanus]